MDKQCGDTKSSSCVIADENQDPLTGTPGAHPVGVGAGAAGGGVAGALIGGAVGGPIGAGVGAVAGAISGGYAGKGAAEALNPTVEHEYWRSEFENRPYFTRGTPYEQYGPAYQFGWESRERYRDMNFEDVEAQLEGEWETRRKQSKLSWNHAKNAVGDAWQRVEKNCESDRCSA